jgi:hypothetical protein
VFSTSLINPGVDCRVTAEGKAHVKKAPALEETELTTIHDWLMSQPQTAMTRNYRKFMAVALETFARGVSEHHKLTMDDFEVINDPNLGQYLRFTLRSVLKNYRGRLNDGPPVSTCSGAPQWVS